MRILLFHPSLLPPKDYGGIERVVLWLAQGLLESGHEVSVAAYPGSRLPRGVRLVEVDPRYSSAMDFLPQLPKSTDVLHFMAPPDEKVWEFLPCAAVVTVHGNGKAGEKYPKNTVFLSQDHARRHGAKVFVYNGINPQEYCFEPEKKDNSFLFFSKTSWRVKNLRGAMRLCRAAGVPLQIGGGTRPYFERLRALLTPSFQWLGPLQGAAKAQVFSRARALLFPVLWPEPFGLVVAEALMSGTPVLGSALGSVPELVPPDVGCVLDVSGGDGPWLEWLNKTSLPWLSERCRQWALERFHYQTMTENYVKIYRKVQAGDVIQEKNPIATGWRMS